MRWVLVTSRAPEDRLARDLKARAADWPDAGIESAVTIGDALAPATIAHACTQGAATPRSSTARPSPATRCLSSASSWRLSAEG